MSVGLRQVARCAEPHLWFLPRYKSTKNVIKVVEITRSVSARARCRPPAIRAVRCGYVSPRANLCAYPLHPGDALLCTTVRGQVDGSGPRAGPDAGSLAGMDTGRPPGTTRTGRGEALEIAEAAAALGITTAALRKRIKRRSVTAEKLQGRWVVYLGDLSTVPNGTLDNNHVDQTGRPSRPRVARGQPAEPGRDGTADTDTSRALVDALQAEVAFLRRELEQRTDELRRRDSIIMALATRPPVLSTPGTAESPQLDPSTPRVVPPSSARVARRRPPWWRRVLAALLADAPQRA